jgi:hypothetical protein
MKMIQCALLVCLFLACDDQSKYETWSDAGAVKSVTAIPTSFNESIKATVETDGGSFTVIGIPSALATDRVLLSSYRNRVWIGNRETGKGRMFNLVGG